MHIKIPKEQYDSTLDIIIVLLRDCQQFRNVLMLSRETLIKNGYCGPGVHGVGDDEIKLIDEALSLYT